jgi:hypothetical protein
VRRLTGISSTRKCVDRNARGTILFRRARGSPCSVTLITAPFGCGVGFPRIFDHLPSTIRRDLPRLTDSLLPGRFANRRHPLSSPGLGTVGQLIERTPRFRWAGARPSSLSRRARQLQPRSFEAVPKRCEAVLKEAQRSSEGDGAGPGNQPRWRTSLRPRQWRPRGEAAPGTSGDDRRYDGDATAKCGWG